LVHIPNQCKYTLKISSKDICQLFPYIINDNYNIIIHNKVYNIKDIITDGTIDPVTGSLLQYGYKILWKPDIVYDVDDYNFYYPTIASHEGHIRLIFRVPQSAALTNSVFGDNRNGWGMYI
jgi:hypothetical protein